MKLCIFHHWKHYTRIISHFGGYCTYFHIRVCRTCKKVQKLVFYGKMGDQKWGNWSTSDDCNCYKYCLEHHKRTKEMKISTLISVLEKAKKERGDIFVDIDAGEGEIGIDFQNPIIYDNEGFVTIDASYYLPLAEGMPDNNC